MKEGELGGKETEGGEEVKGTGLVTMAKPGLNLCSLTPNVFLRVLSFVTDIRFFVIGVSILS